MKRITFYLKSGQTLTFRAEEIRIKWDSATYALTSWSAEELDRKSVVPFHVPPSEIAAITTEDV